MDQLRAGVRVLVQSLADGPSGLLGAGIVDGGTGRFTGASGEFEVLGVGGEVTYDGWVAYAAAAGDLFHPPMNDENGRTGRRPATCRAAHPGSPPAC